MDHLLGFCFLFIQLTGKVLINIGNIKTHSHMPYKGIYAYSRYSIYYVHLIYILSFNQEIKHSILLFPIRNLYNIWVFFFLKRNWSIDFPCLRVPASFVVQHFKPYTTLALYSYPYSHTHFLFLHFPSSLT